LGEDYEDEERIVVRRLGEDYEDEVRMR